MSAALQWYTEMKIGYKRTFTKPLYEPEPVKSPQQKKDREND